MILVFDLSGVFFNNGLNDAVQRISRVFDIEQEVVEFVLNDEFARSYRTGMIKPDEFWKNVGEYLKINDVQRIIEIFFNSYYPLEKTVDFIKKLRSRKIKVGCISNTPEDRAEHLDKKYNFKKLFDMAVFSYEAHAWKPDKEIYETFLRRYSLKPEEVVYIDDKEKNLVPARMLGMKTILFKDIEQLQKELKMQKII